MPPATTVPSLDTRAWFYIALLALQFGVQPSLTRHFTPSEINRSTVVLVQEIMKFCFAGTMLRLTCTTSQIKDLYAKWSLGQWVQVAAFPAALYAIQNVAALTAYQHLDALTFNVLNQTKTLSAALCCYVVMGRQQSYVQVVSLLILLGSALVMERVVPLPFIGSADKTISEDAGALEWDTKHLTHGVAPILLASFISGLAGALSQKNLQSAGGGRNPYQFSMELCAASSISLLLKLLANAVTTNQTDSSTSDSIWDGWTLGTLIPIATNSVGGIVVGLVTKYAGSVQKGFALIFGIFLSGLVQEFITNPSEGGGSVRPEQIVGGVLAALSVYLHATNPPRKSTAPTKKVDSEKKEK